MKYAAFFRGINVGGKNIVKMADLKEMFVDLGCGNVQTYIQSGNVLFDAEDSAPPATERIREAFINTFGFASAVTLRTKNEIIAIMDALPFSKQEIDRATAANLEVEHLYVYLLDQMWPREEIAKIETEHQGPDLLRFGKQEIYLLCHGSIRDSKPAAALAKLSAPMTARNWKTMMRLCEMMNQ